MNRKQRIYSVIINNFSTYEIDIFDNSSEHVGHNNFDGKQETHFKIVLKTRSKSYNRLEIHKKINNLLKDEFSSGLHSLEISILFIS